MRDISLYIGGKKADVAQGEGIFLTARVDNIEEPAIVENPFSQQVLLPPTAANDAIFGYARETTHRTTSSQGGVGTAFNAGKRTEFRLEVNGNICQSGYIKLDHTDRDGYHITLYGGLGALLYDLSFDEDGKPLTLASLDYGRSLDHTINVQTIQEAWGRLAYLIDSGFDYMDIDKWETINYAPLYDGIPQQFDAARQVIVPDAVGQKKSQTDDGTSYAAAGGVSVATYPKSFDGWDMKEFRSYLLRPMIRMAKVWDGIKNFAAARGYTINGDFYEHDVWMTLPRLDEKNETSEERTASASIPSYRQEGEEGASEIVSSSTSPNDYAQHTINARLTEFWFGGSNTRLFFGGTPFVDYRREIHAFLVQGVGYDDNGNVVAESPVEIFTEDWFATEVNPDARLAEMLAINGVTAGVGNVHYTQFQRISSGKYALQGWNNVDIPITFYASGATRVGIRTKWIAVAVEYGNMQPSFEDFTEVYDGGGINSYPCSRVVVGAATDSIVVTTETIRTGAAITKLKLLGGTDTPARYLVGLMRLYGLYVVPTSTDGKTFSLLNRTDFHDSLSRVHDIADRVDHKQAITIEPIAYDKRCYRFKYADANAQWLDKYRAKYGEEYGEARVNTGYGFNNETKDALDGIVFTNCAEVLEQRDTFNKIVKRDGTGGVIPSAMLGGGTYALYDKDGNGKDFALSVPLGNNMSITPFNNGYEGYDFDECGKPQFHDADNKGTGQFNSLLYLSDVSQEYAAAGFYVTDDTAAMLRLNNGVPCWDGRGAAAGVAAFNLPLFQRVSHYSHRSLDLAAPIEVDSPTYIEDPAYLYSQQWEGYISDKYGADSQVMTAYVDLGDLSIPQDALRGKYLFGGTSWAMVEMDGYDLTGGQRFTKCTFVRVRDWENYGEISG